MSSSLLPSPQEASAIAGVTTLAVTTSSGNVLLPVAVGSPANTVTLYNSGAVTAYVALGADNTVAADITGIGLLSIPIPAGTSLAFYRGRNTYLAGITGASSTTLSIYLGNGAVLITGGGGSGGGGGGAVTIADGADITQGAVANTAYVSGSGTVVSVLKGIFAKLSAALATSIADGANITQGAIADTAYVSGSGTVVSVLKGIFAKLSAALAVTQSGTWTVQPGNTANTTAWKVDGSAVTQPVSGTIALSGTQTVQGTAANGASVSGNPVLMGARAATANPSAVTDGQAVDIMTDKIGRIINAGYALPENQVSAFGSTGTTAAVTLFAAPGTNVSIYLTDLEISNTSSTATVLTLNDPSSLQLLAPAGGGREIHLQTPVKWTANTAVTFTSGTVAASVLVGAQGFKGA